MIKVYHLNYDSMHRDMLERALNLLRSPDPATRAEAAWSFLKDYKLYKLVAEVNTNDLDKAYELTNNIDFPWSKILDIRVSVFNLPPTEFSRHRSTSIGDLMEDENGKFYIVQSISFERI